MGELSGTDCFLSENTSVFHVHYYLLKFGSFNVWNYLYTVLKIFFVTWLCFGLWLSQWYVTFPCKFLLVLNDRQIWQTTFYICSSWKLKKKKELENVHLSLPSKCKRCTWTKTYLTSIKNVCARYFFIL